ncbi:transporter [Pseudomonas abieticivorans]|uniref:transporter n=1 Tax=Pseudomonas abieticivorans TaxID=2931382 RepID=UPI0020BDA474|nr:transporter [Pseudomonas sp. PIA16]
MTFFSIDRDWSRHLRGCGLAASLLYGGVANAYVITTEPGDNAPLPEGTDLGVLYYQHAQRNKLMVDGHKAAADVTLDSDVVLARYVKWTSLAGFLVTPQIIVPWGHLKMGGDNQASESAFGDPFIGSNVWLYNDFEKERYFSVGGYIGIPVGHYDGDQGAMNIGENRWKGILEVNYVHALIAHKLYGEITLERDWFGENDDYQGGTLKQSAVFEVQTHLRYVVNASNQVGLTYIHTTGGENRYDDLAQNDSLNTSRYLMTWSHFLTPKTQLQTQAGQDLEVRNGLKENLRLNLRLAHLF